MSAIISYEIAINDIDISLMSFMFFISLQTTRYLSIALNTADRMDPVRMFMKLMVFMKICLSTMNALYSLEVLSMEYTKMSWRSFTSFLNMADFTYFISSGK